jgi:hypothetical protein
MAIVIKLLGTPQQEFNKPYYLVNFDPWREMEDPLMIETTRNLSEAKRFSSAGDAVDYWRLPHKRQRRRLDGKPNRPLSQYTVEFVRVEDD